MAFDITLSLPLGCRERQLLIPIHGTCGLLSNWSSVGVTGEPVVPIFDEWVLWDRDWGRNEENVWLGTL
jgi:hypothetical protein